MWRGQTKFASLSTKNRRRLGVEAIEARLNPAPLPVLMVIADQQDFYYREYNETRQALLQNNVPVVIAATTTNPSTPHPGSGQGTGSGIVIPDVALGNVDASDYSAIVFVGGWGASMYQYAFNDPNFDGTTDNFYSNPFYNGDTNLGDGIIAPQKVVVNDLINDFVDQDKYVTGICHGVTVLAWARVDGVSPLAGKQVVVPLTDGTPAMNYNGTLYTNGYKLGQYEQVIANGGLATPISGHVGNPTTVADDVIVDGRIITGENYDSATYFGTVIAQQVKAADAAPRVAQVDVNDGAAQRSRVTTLRVTFSEAVTFAGNPLAAFNLVRTGPGTPVAVTLSSATVATTAGRTQATLNFDTSSLFSNGSLVDGRYSLVVLSDQVSDGLKLLDGNGDGTPGDNYVFSFHRLFGDANGDAMISAADFAGFRAAFGSTGVSIFDADGDNQVNASDFGQFRQRFGTSI